MYIFWNRLLEFWNRLLIVFRRLWENSLTSDEISLFDINISFSLFWKRVFPTFEPVTRLFFNFNAEKFGNRYKIVFLFAFVSHIHAVGTHYWDFGTGYSNIFSPLCGKLCGFWQYVIGFSLNILYFVFLKAILLISKRLLVYFF